MKLIEYHRAFLANTVNLNATRLDLLASRVESIYAAAAMDNVIGPFVEDYVSQGSWAHRTIIRPLDHCEFDADILLKFTERPEWAGDKKKYVTETLAAFERSVYAGKTEKHTRCVRIIYVDDCHVDVVPYVELEDGRGVIIDTSTNEFESSNPAGFSDWMKEKDDISGGNLRKVIRLLKYLRDFKGTFSVPSVILTALVGERVFAWDAETRYADVPTALKHILSDLDDWLQLYPTLPTITDPSCPDVNFNHRWDQDRYANFRNRMQIYSARIDAAYDEPDRDQSLALWQKVFGPDFKTPASTSSALVPVTKAAVVPYVRAPHEQMIEERGYRWNVTHLATIEGRVMRMAGFRHGLLRSMGVVGKGRQLEFRVRTDVPAPYGVFWKVRNFGDEAKNAAGLRGQIENGESAYTKAERTLYTGTHWIECYVVKDGAVRAWDRHIVRIR
jgi:Second Messenger Oligonucleotide or Dinucleotide Synthetase domain/Adenylyl/Guanylyl and SMODS C-terminal sensor domain